MKNAIINACVPRQSPWGGNAKPNKQVLERIIKKEQKSTDQEELNGIPELVFLHSVFHGNKEALAEALASGQVWKDDDGPFSFLYILCLMIVFYNFGYQKDS